MRLDQNDWTFGIIRAFDYSPQKACGLSLTPCPRSGGAPGGPLDYGSTG
jgi:hypothetical protein